MKKRSPHDSTDAGGPDEKVSTVNSYRRAQHTEKNASSAEGKSEEMEIKNSDKPSSYEFGQPMQRRALRGQLEVVFVCLLLVCFLLFIYHFSVHCIFVWFLFVVLFSTVSPFVN